MPPWVKVESMVICRKNIELFLYNMNGQPTEIKRGDIVAAVVLLQSFVPELHVMHHDSSCCAVI